MRPLIFPIKNFWLKLKEDKTLLKTLVFLVISFVICCSPIFLSFLLKILNPSEYGIIKVNKTDLEITYKEILFYSSLVFTFFVFSLSLRYVKKPRLKTFLISIAWFYLSLAFIAVLTDVIYYLIFAYPITFSAFQTILNSNPEEAKDFLGLYISPGRVVALLLYLALAFALIMRYNRFANLFSSGTFFFTTAVFSVAGIADFIQMSHSEGNGLHNMRYWDIVIGEYNEYREFNRRLEAEKDQHDLSKEYDSYHRKDTLAKTLVLVISESLSRRHMSLYGYPRQTTPNLDTNKNLIVFRNCVTQAPLTIEAVPGLFFNGYLSKKINLITLCNRLGYETTWISNQSGWGKLDRTIVLLSQLCKKNVFMDTRSDDGKSNSSLHYDEAVLPELDQALQDSPGKSKLIVVHLMGCHFDYEKRYPPNKVYFKEEPPLRTFAKGDLTRKIINSYDDAVRYHDSVVNQILVTFSNHTRDKNAALVFLSDHGEELYDVRDHAGHGYPPSRASSEIPYFTSLSPEFKKNYPSMTKIMKQRINTPFSTSNNFYTLLHLLHMDSDKHGHKIRRNSFFSAAYDSTQPRLVQGTDYDDMSL